MLTKRSPITTVIGSTMIAATILFQIFAVCRIAYSKWKHHDNEVVIFIVPDATRGNLPNNRSYNEVLYDLAPMLFLLLAIVEFGSVRIIYSALGLPENYRNVSEIFLYYYDFSELFVMQIGFPAMFYILHPKSRTYVTNILC